MKAPAGLLPGGVRVLLSIGTGLIKVLTESPTFCFSESRLITLNEFEGATGDPGLKFEVDIGVWVLIPLKICNFMIRQLITRQLITLFINNWG